jgi:hypothetical protein
VGARTLLAKVVPDWLLLIMNFLLIVVSLAALAGVWTYTPSEPVGALSP